MEKYPKSGQICATLRKISRFWTISRNLDPVGGLHLTWLLLPAVDSIKEFLRPPTIHHQSPFCWSICCGYNLHPAASDDKQWLSEDKSLQGSPGIQDPPGKGHSCFTSGHGRTSGSSNWYFFAWYFSLNSKDLFQGSGVAVAAKFCWFRFSKWCHFGIIYNYWWMWNCSLKGKENSLS